MQPPPPMTPYEEHITQSYQILNQLRVQTGLMHSSTNFCIDRCLDTMELYTLLRTNNAPITYRLNTDVAEKKCVQNCSGKWDDLFRMTLMATNEKAIQEVQQNAMLKMAEAMQQQQ